MAHRRSRDEGWVPVGRVDLRKAGLPARDARRLALEHAWRTVAGERVARRAPVLRIRRGVLEIAAPEERWAEVLRPLLSTLAARLAGRFPNLGVRKLRLVFRGEERREKPVPVEPITTPNKAARPRPVPDLGLHAAVPREQERSARDRLARAAERYLRARGGGE